MKAEVYIQEVRENEAGALAIELKPETSEEHDVIRCLKGLPFSSALMDGTSGLNLRLFSIPLSRVDEWETT